MCDEFLAVLEKWSFPNESFGLIWRQGFCIERSAGYIGRTARFKARGKKLKVDQTVADSTKYGIARLL